VWACFLGWVDKGLGHVLRPCIMAYICLFGVVLNDVSLHLLIFDITFGLLSALVLLG
jgi:hypothetical protein